MASAASQTTKSLPRWWRRFVVAARRANIFRLLEFVSATIFIVMVLLTYVAFTTAPADGQLLPSAQVAVLLTGTLVPAMALMVLLGRRLAIRRAANSTARMHVRLVFFFSLIAAIPTLLVSGFAAILFQSGVDFWFSDDSRGLMEDANVLARDYYEQNQLEVANETIAMAGDMRFYLQRGTVADESFVDFYGFQMQGRKVSESAILQKLPDGSFRTAAVFGLEPEVDPAQLAPRVLDQVESGEQVVVTADEQRVAAISPIDRDSGIYLYNARNSSAETFSQWQRAQAVTEAYSNLTTRARAYQLRFNAALFFVSLALVGLAVWFALRFADRQVEPLTELVGAARKVGEGNFALRVSGRTGADEIGMLNRAFNRMTSQLEQQTDALMGANEQLDERRAFMETVLESVSAGVISTDNVGQILLMNGPAQSLLLQEGETAPEGLTLPELAPTISSLVEAKLSSGIVNYTKNGDLLTLAVKVADRLDGHVITFEDITRQLVDQRQAAWSDVARRIAHEIKNPLTPIQLATERLKRRYRKQIDTDGELFDELTATIVRQVAALRKMVDEFSSFARLPKPNFRREDAVDLVRQSLFLQEVAHPQIDFGLRGDLDGSARIACDRHQFGQAMTNILKNAVEAVEAQARDAEPDYRGRVSVAMEFTEELLTIAVEDNGIGLPQDRERIAEPYVTTREKGTGLGLAIVTKIVEEHGGDLHFQPTDGGGTRVTLAFARNPIMQETNGAQ